MKINNIVFTKLGVDKDAAPIMSHTQGELTQMTFVPSGNGDYMIKIPEVAGFKMAMPRTGTGMTLTPYYADSNSSKQYVGNDYAVSVDADGQEYTINRFFVANTPDDLYLIIQVADYIEGSSAILYFMNEEVYEPNTQETAYMVSPASHMTWQDGYTLRLNNVAAGDSVWFVFDADYAQDIETVFATTDYPGIALRVHDTHGFSSGVVDENWYSDNSYEDGAVVTGSDSDSYGTDDEETLSGLTGLIYVEVIIQNTDSGYPTLSIWELEHIPFTMSRADFFARAGKPLDYSITPVEASVTVTQLENLFAQQTADLSAKALSIGNTLETKALLIENAIASGSETSVSLATAPATEAVLLLRRLLALTEGSTEAGTVGTVDNRSVAVISESGEKLQDIKVENETRTPTMHIAIDRTGDIPTHMKSSNIGTDGLEEATVASVITDAVVMEETGTVGIFSLSPDFPGAIFTFEWEGGVLAGRAISTEPNEDLILQIVTGTDNGGSSLQVIDGSLYASAPNPLMPRFDLDLEAGVYSIGVFAQELYSGDDSGIGLSGATKIVFEFSSILTFSGNSWNNGESGLISQASNSSIVYRPELDPANQEGEE